MASALILSSIYPCHAQCVELSDRAPQIEMDAFAKSPSSLLEKLRNDKEKLKSRLATYISTDPTVLPSVKTLISAAASADRSAIGAALRVAEARCISTKPDASRKIRDFAERTEDISVKAGYSAAAEDDVAAQQPSRDRAATQPSRGNGLMEGEWKTKLANPFKPIPLPH